MQCCGTECITFVSVKSGCKHKRCMKLYVMQGMNCAQVWNEDEAKEEVLAMVVRTGLHTSMGAMIAYKSRPSMPRFMKVRTLALVLH